MLAASLTYAPHPNSGGIVTAEEYIQTIHTAILAPLLVSCIVENGKFTRKKRSKDITAIVVIEVIPSKNIKAG